MDVDILYKYRDWNSKFGPNLITKKELYFSSFTNFNDPFDSDIRVNYEDLTEEEIEKVAARIVDRDMNGRILSRFQRRKLIGKVKAESALGDPEQLQKNYEEAIRPANEKEIGILSLTKTKDNLLMWSHYSNCHKGYCIGLDYEYLSSLKIEHIRNGQLALIEEIKYSKEYPSYNGASDDPKVDFYALLTKSSDWIYEKEVRFIIRGVVNEAIIIDNAAIKEIILGLKMREGRKEILDLVKNEMPHVQVYEALKKDKNFALEFRKGAF